jgi:HK97 family phage major capsid protein
MADEKTPFELVTEKIDAMNAKVQEVATAVEADPAKYEESKALIDGLREEIKPLIEQQQQALRDEEQKALRGEVTTLKSIIEDLRKPHGDFSLPLDEEGKAVGDEYGVLGLDDTGHYKSSGTRSFFADVRKAAHHDPEAVRRLRQGFEEATNEEGKAIGAGTISEGVSGAGPLGNIGAYTSQGGFLVRPQIERQIVLARESDNVLRPLCSKINVTTNQISLDQLAITTTAGWVAELAEKLGTVGVSLANVTANVFTAAGLAVVSNQLLADSNPSIDGLAIADLAKRLVALEEIAFLNGTGTGQPLGILNTGGIPVTAYTDATPTYNELIDVILDAIAAVEGAHGSPTGILMHPRTWTGILKSKTAAGGYVLGDPNQANPDIRDARTVYRGPQKQLWGYPVYTTNRMPTNLGTGTNESRVIVGDFREALILDRQGITVDESAHFLFTQNATIFRAEERVGFTAARTPSAFTVVGGTGLVNL